MLAAVLIQPYAPSGAKSDDEEDELFLISDLN